MAKIDAVHGQAPPRVSTAQETHARPDATTADRTSAVRSAIAGDNYQGDQGERLDADAVRALRDQSQPTRVEGRRRPVRGLPKSDEDSSHDRVSRSRHHRPHNPGNGDDVVRPSNNIIQTPNTSYKR